MLGRITRYLREHVLLVVVLCLALAATATATATYITGDGSVRSVRAGVAAGTNQELLEVPDHVAIIGRCAPGGAPIVFVRNRSRTKTLTVWTPDEESWMSRRDELDPIGGARTQRSFGLGDRELLRISVGYADATSPYTSFDVFGSGATAGNGMRCQIQVRAITTNATDVSLP